MKASTLCPLDQEAARRTMDLYLGRQPDPLPDFDDMHLVVASPELDPEVAGRKALFLMECAASCAFENSARLSGKPQQQSIIVGHLICLSRQMMECYYEGTQKSAGQARRKTAKKKEENGAKPCKP